MISFADLKKWTFTYMHVNLPLTSSTAMRWPICMGPSFWCICLYYKVTFYTIAANIMLWEHLKYNLVIHVTWKPPTWIVTYWRVWSCRLQALVNTCDLNYGLEMIPRHSLIFILSGCRDLDSMHSVARFAIRSKWATTFKDSFVLKFLRHTLLYDLVTSITNYMYIDQSFVLMAIWVRGMCFHTYYMLEEIVFRIFFLHHQQENC